jgi:short-subunit dehydrogenase
MLITGSVVLVTGASRGIGAATARVLADRGARVLCSGRDEVALRSVAEPLGASVVVADLADPSAPATLVAQALEAFGRIDALVANAGIGYYGDVASMPPERLSYLLDVNLRAPMLLAREWVGSLRSGRTDDRPNGAIVFVSSIAGAVGVPTESVYSATKAGLDTFADCLREEVRSEGISVSVVSPGVVVSEFFTNRGASYDRRFPRPMPAQRVAEAIVGCLESGREHVVLPRWLWLADRLAATTPRLYRRLARRFG